jgi:DNA polymerase-3 subunit gamma/tau
MGQALYRKYRSKSLAEIVGQEHITRVLERAIKSKSISHAYLFTGPRGTGKTSIARILAYEANELAYDESNSHLDIIEIDAASNRRIDEVRDLREKVHVAPSSAKYKVYIIDEVHMLTREAFNALLKTLEEPPAHVIFILATTEFHKLPETIVSRTQHFAFRPVAQEKVVTHLSDIAKKEKISIEKEALELIARQGEGSFRDSISLLDQVRSYADKVSLNDVRAMVGLAAEESIDTLINAVAAKSSAEVVSLLKELRDQGVEAAMIAKQLGEQLRKELLDDKTRLTAADSMTLQTNLLQVAASPQPFTLLQIHLLDVVFKGRETPTQPPSSASDTVVKKAEPKTAPKDPPKTATPKPKSEAAKVEEPIAPVKTGVPFDVDLWATVLDEIKKTYNTLYGILRMAKPQYDDTTLILHFKFAFHQKRISDPKNKKIVIDAIQNHGGSIKQLECVLGEAPESSDKSTGKTDPETLGNISNIFGSAELLES